MRNPARLCIALVAAAGLSLTASHNNKSSDNSGNTPDKGMRAAAMTDGDIAAIVETVNRAEIDAAEAARNRSASAEVRAFADRMWRDHGDNNRRLNEIVRAQNITPTSNATSDMLSDGAKRDKAELGALTGRAFDVAYMQKMVQGHDDVLRMLDRDLIPKAQNAKLRSFLEETRKAVAAHLDHARQVRGGLGAA